MKKLVFILIAVSCISAAVIKSIYESLEIPKEAAKKCLLLSIGEGSVQQEHYSLVSKAKDLPVELRVSGVRELIQLAKEYSQTDAFADDYKKWRKEKLNPNEKTKLGLPKFGKMLDNNVNNKLDKAENEKKYPSDPQELIRKRLTDFLQISSTVDFDAEVMDRQFTKPEYQKKNGYWKMCYRAGREVVQAAREEAQKWLDEINQK